MESILVTSTGSVATDITLKSLKRMGYRVVGCNIYPREWVVESCEMDMFYQVPPVNSNKEYLEKIKEICMIENIRFIFPMIDYEVDLYDRNREWFLENGITLCIPPHDSLGIIRNKNTFQDFVTKNATGIQAIPTKLMSQIEQLEWDFPVVCKPYNGRSSQGLKYIYDLQEWESFKGSVNQDEYIVEPFIEGPIIVVEVINQPAFKKSVAISRKEIISTPHGCSLTVLVFQDKFLEEAIIDLSNKLGIVGDVNYECIEGKDGSYYLIECNPRFSAGNEFACMSGYDCIENHLKCFLDTPIEDYHFKHNMIIARKYEEYITAVNVDVPINKTIK